MKTITLKATDFANRPHAPYPNAATYREVRHNARDMLRIAAIGAGTAAIGVILLAIC